MLRLREIEEALNDPAKSRELLFTLYRLPDHDWNDWELDWMESQFRRHPKYLLSEKERAIVARLNHNSASFTEYQGVKVLKWIETLMPLRSDFTEEQEQTLKDWHARQVASLRRRQLAGLIAMLRMVDLVEDEAA